MWLVGSKPIRSNITIPTTSFSAVFFTNDVMCHGHYDIIYHPLSHQFSIFEDVEGWQPWYTPDWKKRCRLKSINHERWKFFSEMFTLLKLLVMMHPKNIKRFPDFVAKSSQLHLSWTHNRCLQLKNVGISQTHSWKS